MLLSISNIPITNPIQNLKGQTMYAVYIDDLSSYSKEVLPYALDTDINLYPMDIEALTIREDHLQ